jgi:hypothetical protein
MARFEDFILRGVGGGGVSNHFPKVWDTFIEIIFRPNAKGKFNDEGSKPTIRNVNA